MRCILACVYTCILFSLFSFFFISLSLSLPLLWLAGATAHIQLQPAHAFSYFFRSFYFSVLFLFATRRAPTATVTYRLTWAFSRDTSLSSVVEPTPQGLVQFYFYLFSYFLDNVTFTKHASVCFACLMLHALGCHNVFTLLAKLL